MKHDQGRGRQAARFGWLGWLCLPLTRHICLGVVCLTAGCLRDVLISGVFHKRNKEQGTQVIDIRGVLETACDIARGLAYLHSKHLVHGDLKTANVMLQKCESGHRGFEAKVADFGLARLLSNTDEPLLVSKFGTVCSLDWVGVWEITPWGI